MGPKRRDGRGAHYVSYHLAQLARYLTGKSAIMQIHLFNFHFVDGTKWSKFHTITELGKLIYLFNGNTTMFFTFTKFSGEKHKFH